MSTRRSFESSSVFAVAFSYLLEVVDRKNDTRMSRGMAWLVLIKFDFSNIEQSRVSFLFLMLFCFVQSQLNVFSKKFVNAHTR